MSTYNVKTDQDFCELQNLESLRLWRLLLSRKITLLTKTFNLCLMGKGDIQYIQ